ncbi:hypothetical protein EJB05_56147, partial [Eragrostis curvula]
METHLADLLPDDVLADVLGRLVPRDLALSRTVCKAWCAVVDARRLLRAELLPLSLAGIFINFHGYVSGRRSRAESVQPGDRIVCFPASLPAAKRGAGYH